MVNCHRESCRLAKLRVIEALSIYRAAPSEAKLASLKAALDNWDQSIKVWGESLAAPDGPSTSAN